MCSRALAALPPDPQFRFTQLLAITSVLTLGELTFATSIALSAPDGSQQLSYETTRERNCITTACCIFAQPLAMNAIIKVAYSGTWEGRRGDVAQILRGWRGHLLTSGGQHGVGV